MQRGYTDQIESLPQLPVLTSAGSEKEVPTLSSFPPKLLICLINTIPGTFSSCSFPPELEEQSPLACSTEEV